MRVSLHHLAPAVLFLTATCNSTPPAPVSAPQSTTPEKAKKTVIPDTEAKAKPSIGKTCASDNDCPLYLRCERLSCAAPPALDGTGDRAAAPTVAISGSEGEAQFSVELAANPDERARGLMFRPRMHNDWGMLFIYPAEKQQSFWMRNTYIPLDIVFISADMKVVGVSENAEPMTETSREVPGKSRYVLEINAGLSKTYGITKGSQVRFARIPPELTR